MPIIAFILMLIFDAAAIGLLMWLGDIYSWSLGPFAMLVGFAIGMLGVAVFWGVYFAAD